MFLCETGRAGCTYCCCNSRGSGLINDCRPGRQYGPFGGSGNGKGFILTLMNMRFYRRSSDDLVDHVCCPNVYFLRAGNFSCTVV